MYYIYVNMNICVYVYFEHMYNCACIYIYTHVCWNILYVYINTCYIYINMYTWRGWFMTWQSIQVILTGLPVYCNLLTTSLKITQVVGLAQSSGRWQHQWALIFDLFPTCQLRVSSNKGTKPPSTYRSPPPSTYQPGGDRSQYVQATRLYGI